MFVNKDFTELRESSKELQKDSIPGALQIIAEDISNCEDLEKQELEIIQKRVTDKRYNYFLDNKNDFFMLPLYMVRENIKRLKNYREELIKILEKVEKWLNY